ncbi:benzoate-CoA ligase family protein [Rhodopseudomonas sp. NSM]|uniref:benzoate-CoA ligase family protein n=1 Tax=Rhodopseudomonas sp. NSM TaxID=3457630 RepID=UPI00403630EE
MNAAVVTPPPERFNIAAHLLQANAGRPDKLAFVDDSSTLTFAQLDDKARRLAAGLRSLGVKREERVFLLMLDGTDWPVAFLGAIYAGIVPVAVNTLLTADDYAYMLEHSRAQAVLVSGALRGTLKAALTKSDHEVHKVIVSHPDAPLEPDEVEFDAFVGAQAPLEKPAATHADDPAFWLYSSGSTGRPKGVVHTQANPYWSSELYGRNTLQLREDDVCFSAAKLFFAYGLGNALTFPLTVGATTLLMPERPTPDAVFRRWLGGVAGLKPTVFFGAPTGFAGMLVVPNLPAREQLALRLASSAGEALPAEIGQRFQRHFGIDIVDGIGSTEMLHIFLSNRPDKVRYGTTGWPVPGYGIELRGDSGGPVPDGEPGDLYIHGPSSATMYWGNRAKTQETFQGGWTKSGDKYIRNEDGSYTYAGRTDDMLKVSGIYVSPFEIEATLVQHPSVLEAAVVGIADENGLTKPKAFVVQRPGVTVSEAELKSFIKDRLAPYKYPRSTVFVDELPKTATGKIQRFKLREGILN